MPLPGNRLVAITGSDPHAQFFNIKIHNNLQSFTIEPSFCVSLHTSPTSSVSRVYTSYSFSYIITTCKDSFDALQIPHEMETPPIVKRFRRDGVEDDYLSLGLSLMVGLRRDRLMDFTTYDLRREQIQMESYAQIRIFLGNGFMRFVACDEGSGRIVMRSHRMYFLLEI